MSSLREFFTADLKPTGNPEFTAVFVRMWIAGTMGAYFTFLFRNLALDLPTFSIHDFDCSYTFVVWIRYAYLLWFLAYFFASNVRYERTKLELSAWDVGFDVTQAAIGIVAAFFLGFIVRAADFVTSPSCAVEAANGAIALICVFSLICFGCRKYPAEKTIKIAEKQKLNRLRWSGLASSLLALGLVILASRIAEECRVWVAGVAAVFGVVPFIALWRFIRIGWKSQSADNEPRSEATIQGVAPKA